LTARARPRSPGEPRLPKANRSPTTDPPDTRTVKVPVGFTQFRGEIVRTPRSWVERAYPTLTYFNKVDKGGHFAAWEEPQLFATEIRAAFRTLR